MTVATWPVVVVQPVVSTCPGVETTHARHNFVVAKPTSHRGGSRIVMGPEQLHGERSGRSAFRVDVTMDFGRESHRSTHGGRGHDLLSRGRLNIHHRATPRHLGVPAQARLQSLFSTFSLHMSAATCRMSHGHFFLRARFHLFMTIPTLINVKARRLPLDLHS